MGRIRPILKGWVCANAAAPEAARQAAMAVRSICLLFTGVSLGWGHANRRSAPCGQQRFCPRARAGGKPGGKSSSYAKEAYRSASYTIDYRYNDEERAMRKLFHSAR